LESTASTRRKVRAPCGVAHGSTAGSKISLERDYYHVACIGTLNRCNERLVISIRWRYHENVVYDMRNSQGDSFIFRAPFEHISATILYLYDLDDNIIDLIWIIGWIISGNIASYFSPRYCEILISRRPFTQRSLSAISVTIIRHYWDNKIALLRQETIKIRAQLHRNFSDANNALLPVCRHTGSARETY